MRREGFECPDYRCVFRDGKISLVAWTTYMPRRLGPMSRLFQDLDTGAVIADFTIIRDGGEHELVVAILTTVNDDSFRDAVVRFCERLGYRRLWMESEMIDLDPSAAAAWNAVARTQCSACGAEWYDSTFAFWAAARESGITPPRCALCFSPMPQWSTDEPSLEAAAVRSGASRAHEACRGDTTA